MEYYSTRLKSPKKEEEQVPDTNINNMKGFCSSKQACASEETDIMDELEGIWGMDESQEKLSGDGGASIHQLNWDFMELEDEEEEEGEDDDSLSIIHCYEEGFVKKENVGFWDRDDYYERRFSLNLNLNYQEVMDAWSDRSPLWTDDSSLSAATSNCFYMGEVPVMEEEKMRREASVQRYKEKRQNRLFSKKIRYQVRKLNADKRPRLKGRFVKRVS